MKLNERNNKNPDKDHNNFNYHSIDDYPPILLLNAKLHRHSRKTF